MNLLVRTCNYNRMNMERVFAVAALLYLLAAQTQTVCELSAEKE